MEFHDGIAARTIFGEARGEGTVGMTAVAHVIKNRLNAGRFGQTVAEVCLAPFQFSAWNQNDPNRKLLLRANDNDLTVALGCWRDAFNSSDPTFGSTHYKVVGVQAFWSVGHSPAATIGHHEFYNDVA